MSPALVLSSQIKCSAPGDKEKMNKLAALERKMQVTGDYGSDSESDRRAEREREREGRPLARRVAARRRRSREWNLREAQLVRRANITCCKLFGVFAALHYGRLKINTGARTQEANRHGFSITAKTCQRMKALA